MACGPRQPLKQRLQPPHAPRCALFWQVAGGLGERLGYGGIKVELPAETTTGRLPAVAMEGRNVTFKLENSGKVAGAEVAQVYASLPKEGLGADEPPKRLVAFEKIKLDPVCDLVPHSPLSICVCVCVSFLCTSVTAP